MRRRGRDPCRSGTSDSRRKGRRTDDGLAASRRCNAGIEPHRGRPVCEAGRPDFSTVGHRRFPGSSAFVSAPPGALRARLVPGGTGTNQRVIRMRRRVARRRSCSFHPSAVQDVNAATRRVRAQGRAAADERLMPHHHGTQASPACGYTTKAAMRGPAPRLSFVLAALLALAPALGAICDTCCQRIGASSIARISTAEAPCPAHAGPSSADPDLSAAPNGCVPYQLPVVEAREARASSGSQLRSSGACVSGHAGAAADRSLTHMDLTGSPGAGDMSPPGRPTTILRI